MTIETLLVYFPVEESWLESLRERLPDTEIIYRGLDDLTPEDVARADAVFGNIPRRMLKDAASLKWLHLSSAGADGYTWVADRGALLTNSTGAYDAPVAEHMVALTAALCINLPAYFRQQREHLWRWYDSARSIDGSTVAVLGCGGIGRAYARRMKALGAHTIGVRRAPGPAPEGVDEVFTTDCLERVLPRADIVSMVLPNTPETRGIMDRRRIALMRDGALLINAGRGNAVEPQALYEALASGKLAGAALDVTHLEPLPGDDKLWDAPNLIITPHVSGGWSCPMGPSPDRSLAVCKLFEENLEAYLSGGPMPNAVDPKTGYKRTRSP